MTSADENVRGGVEAAMAQALEKVRKLCEEIRDSPTTEDEAWFRNLLFGLLRCALLDHSSVRVGTERSVYLAAWGRRNLLELKVVTEFILESEKNAVDFRNELVIDAKEFYEALSESHRATHKELLTTLSEMAMDEEFAVREAVEEVLAREKSRGPQTQATDLEANGWRQLMVEFGLTERDKPKRASDVAKRINRQESFNPMFKICSKIMHRTAFSIATSITGRALDPAVSLLSNSADNDLLSIFDLINKHFKNRGVRPPIA